MAIGIDDAALQAQVQEVFARFDALEIGVEMHWADPPTPFPLPLWRLGLAKLGAGAHVLRTVGEYLSSLHDSGMVRTNRGEVFCFMSGE